MHDDNVLVSPGLTSILFRSIEVWLVISVAETVHGIARVTLLQPLVGISLRDRSRSLRRH